MKFYVMKLTGKIFKEFIMPQPRKGESYREYINRATSYMIKVEGLKPGHARAKAEGMWRQHKKKRSS